VWDPLALSAFLAPPGSVSRVLLLGLGGGAAVHLLRRHVRPRRIVAVEREAAIAVLAEQWFGVGGPDVEIVTQDAVRWARSNRERFDTVIDDIFGERSGEPLRAAGGAAWWRGLARRLTRGGVLVVNFTEGREAPRSPLATDAWFVRRFPSAVRFTFPGYTNSVVALGPPGPDGRPVGPAALLARIRASPGFASPGERRLLRLRASALRSRATATR
jgi:spermidine synthase